MTLWDAAGDAEGAAEGVAAPESGALCVSVARAEMEAEGAFVALPLPKGDPEGEGASLRDPPALSEGTAVAETVHATDAEKEEEPLPLPLEPLEREPPIVGDPTAVPVTEAQRDSVPEGVPDAAAVTEPESVAAPVADSLDDADGASLRLGVPLSDGDALPELEGAPLGLTEGLPVGATAVLVPGALAVGAPLLRVPPTLCEPLPDRVDAMVGEGGEEGEKDNE